MVKKRFDRELFNENDRLARAAGKRYWISKRYQVIDNPDTYGPDLIIDTGTEKFYGEVEIKRVWSGESFAYDTLQIPARKKKFIGLDMPTQFIVFNADQTYGFLCTCSQLAAAPVVEVANKYVYSGEMFYQVPIASLLLIEVPSEDKAEAI
jgi:hypothetical protein